MTKKIESTPGYGGGLNWLATGPGPRIAFEAPDSMRGNAGAGAGAPASAGVGMSGGASIDTIHGNAQSGFTGQGSVAQRLLSSGFNVNALRTNATLRYDEWRLWDQTVLEVARYRMVGVADLIANGLTTDIPNALGHTVFSWQRMSDFTGADISMSGISESENDRLTFDFQNMPLPIIHKDFNINIRALAASRNGGMPLDTMQIAYATKVVTERIEQLLFIGSTALGSNNTIYGYTTTPTRLTGSVTASWLTATGSQIIADALTMIGVANAQNMWGPWMVYVGTRTFTNLGNDFKANGDLTIMERLLNIPGIAGIKPAFWLTEGQVLFVQMTKEVVDMLMGIQPTVVEWESHGGMVTHYKVMAIMVPRMRMDQASQKGIIHYS
jgi:uncharacterized linocin/CFP29 family protein